MTHKSNALIYSTDIGGKCPVCGWPQRDCQWAAGATRPRCPGAPCRRSSVNGPWRRPGSIGDCRRAP